MPVARQEYINATREKILDIAKRRFSRFGYKKTSMDEICKEARMSKKTLYQIFKTKEDLFVALFIREALTSRRFVMGRLRKVDDPLEKITKFMQITREYFIKEPFMVDVLRDTDGLYAPFLKEKYKIFAEEGILKVFSDILKSGIEKGDFRKVDTEVTAYIIFKLFQAFTYARTMNRKATRDSDKMELQEVVEFISKALTK